MERYYQYQELPGMQGIRDYRNRGMPTRQGENPQEHSTPIDNFYKAVRYELKKNQSIQSRSWFFDACSLFWISFLLTFCTAASAGDGGNGDAGAGAFSNFP